MLPSSVACCICVQTRYNAVEHSDAVSLRQTQQLGLKHFDGHSHVDSSKPCP